MAFQRSLALGKIYEQKLKEVFEHDTFEVMEGHFPDYDAVITHNGESITFESKADTYAKYYQSIAIEFSYKDNPSGIETTKADYWVHWIVGTDELFIIPTYKLRKIIKKVNPSWKSGGDGYNSNIYILDMKYINKYRRHLLS